MPHTVSTQQHSVSDIINSNKTTSQKLELLKTASVQGFTNEDLLILLAQTQESVLKRELVSIVGKTRKPEYKDFLFALLNDRDPKIIIQAIRGLVAFKDENIFAKIKEYRKHPNELVSIYVERLLNKNKKERKTTTIPNDCLKNIVVNGDTLKTMQLIDDNSIDLTFTSPPYYNARDYSIYQSYDEYLSFLSQVFQQIHRITAEGRFFVINTSPIIIPRASRQTASMRYPIPFDIHRFIMEAGFEFIDDILWLKPEASVKNRNGGFMQHRKPLAYKPNLVTEYIMVYRKKTDKLIDWNIRQYDEETVEKSKIKGEYESTNVWSIDPVSDKVHSAIFPEELCRRVIAFYSFVGDLVFDPFAGSGTVGKVAYDNERNFFLTELNQEYFKRIQTKIKGIFNQNTKFMSLLEFKNYYGDK